MPRSTLSVRLAANAARPLTPTLSPLGRGRRLLRRLNPLLLPARPAPRQHRLQERPGITALLPHDVLRRSRGDDLAAAVAAFGAEVDDPVGGSITPPPPASVQTREHAWMLQRCRRG